MRKTSSQGKVCTYCDNPALPDTDPPVCQQCKQRGMHKQASEQQQQPRSLKQLLQ